MLKKVGIIVSSVLIAFSMTSCDAVSKDETQHEHTMAFSHIVSNANCKSAQIDAYYCTQLCGYGYEIENPDYPIDSTKHSSLTILIPVEGSEDTLHEEACSNCRKVVPGTQHSHWFQDMNPDAESDILWIQLEKCKYCSQPNPNYGLVE